MDIKSIAQKFVEAEESIISPSQQKEIEGEIMKQFIILQKKLITTERIVDLNEFKMNFLEGVILVSAKNNNLHYLTSNLNLMFRGLHDYHHVKYNLGTHVLEEIELGLIKHSASDLFNKFYRSEVVYQACYWYAYGHFMPKQKLVLEDLIV